MSYALLRCADCEEPIDPDEKQSPGDDPDLCEICNLTYQEKM